MATTIAQLAFSSGDTASFKQWTAAFVSAMQLVTGWLQTADTGQLNLTTISGLANNSDQSAGYQIYTFTDALSGSNPIYVKFEFGSGANVTGTCSPAMWMTVGTATSGTGNLTGQVSGRFQISENQNNVTTTNNACYFSGASNRFVCSLYESLNTNMIFSVERSKDSSGNDNTDGFMVFVASRRNGPASQFIPFTGILNPQLPMWISPFSPYNTMQNGNQVGFVFPTPFNGVPYNSGYNIAISAGSDIAQFTTNIGTIYGQSHAYLQLQYSNSIYLFPQLRMDATGLGAGSSVNQNTAPYSANTSYIFATRPMIRYD